MSSRITRRIRLRALARWMNLQISAPVRMLANSVYRAAIAEPERCRGCGNCEPVCPTHAIRVVDRRSVLDAALCVGCGQCVRGCRRGALHAPHEARLR